MSILGFQVVLLDEQGVELQRMGLSLQSSSAWLSELAKMGLIEKRGRVRFGNRAWSNTYRARR